MCVGACVFLELMMAQGRVADCLFCGRMGFYRLEGLHLPLITTKLLYSQEPLDEALQQVKVSLESHTVLPSHRHTAERPAQSIKRLFIYHEECQCVTLSLFFTPKVLFFCVCAG